MNELTIRICIIICYYGEFPKWFGLWEESAGNNKKVDFMIFTDQKMVSKYNNIHFETMSFERLNDLVCRTLDKNAVIYSSYKLCDYRPMYGVIFSDYIKEYDFWGHCDLDQIFGDIESFLNDAILNKYNKVFELGHLTLYKNSTVGNSLFQLDGGMNWRDAISDKHSCYFDEVEIRKKCKQNSIEVYTPRIYADITYFHKRFTLSNDLLTKEEIANNNFCNQVFYFENGRIYRAYVDGTEIKTNEYIYIHFQKRAMKNVIDPVKSYYIFSDGFVEKEPGTPCIEDIKKYNPYKGKMIEFGETFKFWFNEYKKRLLLRLGVI